MLQYLNEINEYHTVLADVMQDIKHSPKQHDQYPITEINDDICDSDVSGNELDEDLREVRKTWTIYLRPYTRK